MNSPFDQFLADQNAADIQTKSAAEIQAENTYWDVLTQKYAATENNQTAELFNAAFDDEIEKFAQLDPEFGEILARQLAETAFNAGYAQVKGT